MKNYMIDFYAETAEFSTLLDFLRFGMTKAEEEGAFYGHGTDNAYDDMLALIFGCLNLKPDSDLSLLQARLTPKEKALLSDKLKARIIDKVPVPYLTNKAYFCGLSFYVDERVLIPRSPLGEFIENQGVPWLNPERIKRILDIGTGSGCLAIAASYAFPEALVDAVDLSPAALEVAKINCQRHGLKERTLRLIQSSTWKEVPKHSYDLILSNPPYVGQEELATLPGEYCHEPKLALEAENQGLAIVIDILKHAHEYLSEEGFLVVEVGNSEDALIQVFPDLPFTWLDFANGGHGVFLLTAIELKAYFMV